MHDEFQIESRRKLLPAWILSVGVHVVLLTCLPLFISVSRDSQLNDVTDRSVRVVLALKSTSREHEYFDEAAMDQADASQDAGSSQAEIQVAASESLVVSEFTLPAVSDPILPGLTSIDTPRLSVSGSRPRLPGVDESAIIAAEQARMRSAALRSPIAEIGLFGSKEAIGRSFVFLIDRSQSMGGGGLGVLQDAEDELVRVLQGLGPEHQFQVVVYHDQSVYLERRELLDATEENKALVPGFLGSKAAFGATEHERALMSALSLEPDVIFLLTDGGEPALKEQQIRNIAKYAGPRTSIHCIQFGIGPHREANNFLARLAAATGGEYGYVDVNQRRR
ncbi:MAG: hypothetical protein H6822_26490 [Planctomycetaceae bacterium]|nr:hypothetical protein [Planctomycetales bacterium]MCB9925727.1 hypothetical protein [Planctomycetaceae bacterium]